jgi:hypothetical protein
LRTVIAAIVDGAAQVVRWLTAAIAAGFGVAAAALKTTITSFNEFL